MVEPGTDIVLTAIRVAAFEPCAPSAIPPPISSAATRTDGEKSANAAEARMTPRDR